MCFIYTIKYYSAFWKMDTMKFAGKSIELEKNILTEVKQTKKDNFVM